MYVLMHTCMLISYTGKLIVIAICNAIIYKEINVPVNFLQRYYINSILIALIQLKIQYIQQQF